jgi:hypothetical protein
MVPLCAGVTVYAYYVRFYVGVNAWLCHKFYKISECGFAIVCIVTAHWYQAYC